MSETPHNPIAEVVWDFREFLFRRPEPIVTCAFMGCVGCVGHPLPERKRIDHMKDTTDQAPDVARATAENAEKAASAAGHMLSKWRWHKTGDVLEAAGQLVMFLLNEVTGRDGPPDETP